jgi:hypothetical protein
VWESTESIRVVEETLVACIIIASTSTSTIQATSERWVFAEGEIALFSFHFLIIYSGFVLYGCKIIKAHFSLTPATLLSWCLIVDLGTIKIKTL